MDEAGNKLPTRAVIICEMTPFVITEDRDIATWPVGRQKMSIRQMTSISSSSKFRYKSCMGKGAKAFLAVSLGLSQVVGGKLGGGR